MSIAKFPPTHLRFLALNDVPELTELIQSEAQHLQPWEPKRAADYFTLSKQQALAEQALEQHKIGNSVPFLITSETGELLGRITLSSITRGAFQSCALGYWIRQGSLRKGHATRAVAQAEKHAFNDLGLHRVQAETLPENTGSQRVLELNGFRQYGVAPQYLKINGQWRDHLMYQVLNEQYVENA